VFLKDWWLDVVCGDEWDVAIKMKGDNVAGVWPYHIAKRAGVNILRNAMLTPYMGPHVFLPKDLKPQNADRFENETIESLIKELPQAPVWNLSLMPDNKQAGIYRRYGLQAEVQQTFLINLEQSEEQLQANMNENTRRNIKSKISIENNVAALSLLYQYQQHTLKSKQVGQPYSEADMQQLMDACMEHESTALWTATENNEVMAIVWNVWDEQTCYYFMGAQKPGGDSSKAMTALLWHSILEARKRGNKIFDLEGSMDAGVERFFRGFGGERSLYLVLKKNNSFIWKAAEKIRKIF
jgi:hypothetical protein